MTAAVLIRHARRRAGLTQVQLADRLGLSQAAVARLERPGANPTIRTLERALRAAGQRLDLRAADGAAPVDEAQLAEHLRLTPAERARAHDRAYGETAELAGAARRVR